MTFRVFVSYSTRDLEIASELGRQLKRVGAEPYVAEYSAKPGQSLSQEIANAIDACDLFLLLWSTDAEKSHWVPQEIGLAKAKGKPIMPVVLHAGIKLTGFIQDLKYLAWYQNPVGTLAWLNNYIAREKVRKDTRELAVMVAGIGAILFVFGNTAD